MVHSRIWEQTALQAGSGQHHQQHRIAWITRKWRFHLCCVLSFDTSWDINPDQPLCVGSVCEDSW